ncbi:MAG: hypothetical protein MUC97_18885 [Bernardetiaceae bacterium]|jgi:hypothetical protein|nr:hypothetical protein [Bernardetiaceae bacterium]
MNDTAEWARQKQHEIIFSKTQEERLLMGLEMIDYAYQVVENSIRQAHPGIGRGDLVAEIFKRYFAHEFPPEQVEVITAHIRRFHAQREAAQTLDREDNDAQSR